MVTAQLRAPQIKRLAYILKNGFYEERRKLEGQSGFADLTTEVARDGARVKKSLKEFSFAAKDIKEHSDLSFDDFKEVFSELKDEVEEAEKGD